MSVFHENMLIGASGQGAAGPTAGRSVRFNAPDSAYLSRTPASAGNQKLWTFSFWYKTVLQDASNRRHIFTARDGSGNHAVLNFRGSDDKLEIYYYAGSLQFQVLTTAIFRDPSAWYHVVVAYDTDQATASNRIKLYVNGTQITAFDTANYPTLGYSSALWNSTNAHAIGRENTVYLSGYLALVHFIDGQALTPSSFGETSATTGQWIAKTYSGSYGTNGFFLDFLDNSTAAALGYDAAGSNDWTVNNISVASGGPTSVAAASGALPIYNTTDTYGTTKGTGTRTDSNSSSISLAIAMDGANNGTTFTDESATIKGSGSAKSITRNGDTKTSTTQSKFYGSSGYFDGTGDYLSLANDADFNFGTGDFTIEAWVYVTAWDGSGQNNIITKWNQSGNGYAWKFLVQSNGNIRFGTGNNGTLSTEFDFSAGSIATNTWHHFAVTRSGTSIRVFMNGVQIGSSATSSNTLSSSSGVVVGASPDGGISQLMNGYMADLRVYKGVAKYTAAFNPPTSTQIASVAAGNDSLRDHPTSAGTSTGLGGEVAGNYCTWNPLDKNASLSPANGNLDITGVSSAHRMIRGTIGVSSGKWYWEITASNAGGSPFVGIAKQDASLANGQYVGANATSWGYASYLGQKYNNGSASSYGAGYTTGDVIGVALDADNGTLTFYKNNTSQGTAFTGLTSGPYFPAVSVYDANDTFVLNAGQRAFAYTAPSGFSPLVDTLLPTPTIAKPSDVFNAGLYTGTGSSSAIAVAGPPNPDLVWIKCRSNGLSHAIYDEIRGNTKRLYSNDTAAEYTYGSAIYSPTSTGINITTTDGDHNTNNFTYVAWMWDAGSSNATNTSGTITSTVRANISAGFSVVTWTGNGSPGTLGHGLGVAPQMIIIKNRSASSNWIVGHQYINSSPWNNWCLILNSTGAVSGAVAAWGGLGGFAPTSSLFGVGIDTNNNGNNFVAYAWAPVAGYSAFGSYTAGSEPFVHLGFRPRFLMIKNSSTGGSNWVIHDTARSSYNYVFTNLSANSNGADNGNSAYPFIDMLSNGFKLRSTYLDYNQGSDVYVYAAWAEAPFPYARAR